MGDGESKRSRGFKQWMRTAVAGFAVLLVFTFGVAVGQGDVRFGSERQANTGLPEKLDLSSVQQVYDVLRDNYDGELQASELLDGIKHGLANATGDPYTVYLDSEEAAEFQNQLNGTFSGIGAELGKDADDNLIIVSPIEGFPAAKAGLRPQDMISAIDGESTAGMGIYAAVSKIRGEKGTEVTLDVIRGDKPLSFKIIRADITIPSVKHEILGDNIGYLQISQFGEDTAKLAAEAAREFKQKNVKGVVLDLRGNPGGLLDAGISVASLWLPRGEIVMQQKRGDEVVATERATGNDILRNIPTVVLINQGSASAAEIVAGALKDQNAATLLGEKSYGKGSVQEIHPLSGGGELKVTIARWFRPSGENIDKQGVSPDREIKMSDDDYAQNQDPQKDAALQLVR